VQTNAFQAIQEWYLAECNGDWEHTYGVHIETIDNPGWLLKIDLSETSLEDRPFSTAVREHESEWFHCQRTETQFVAAGGPLMLTELLSIFLRWAQSSEETTP
jgi:hypothetical protein